MRREDVVKAVEEKLNQLGIPRHTRGVKPVPSSLECTVLLGATAKRMNLRTGIPRWELEQQLADLEAWYLQHQNQVDLEEAIEKTEAAQ